MLKYLRDHLNERISYHSKRLSGETLVCFSDAAEHLEHCISRSAILELNNIDAIIRNQEQLLGHDIGSLRPEEWNALMASEERLYDANCGVHPFTHVMTREDGNLAFVIWNQVEINMDGTGETDGHTAAQRCG